MLAFVLYDSLRWILLSEGIFFFEGIRDKFLDKINVFSPELCFVSESEVYVNFSLPRCILNICYQFWNKQCKFWHFGILGKKSDILLAVQIIPILS